MENQYECIIVGGGPAGLAAGLYTGRDKVKTLMIEKFMPGGQINNTNRIENYPGIVRIVGPGLIEQMKKQVEKYSVEIKNGAEVTRLEKQSSGEIVVHCDKEKFTAKSVILAPGSDYRKLGISGEDEFREAGAGISYCGTCDAPFFKGKKVLAVGGGNTALEETLHLTKFAAEVTLIHRRDEFRADRVLVEELQEKLNEPDSNLKVKYSTVATAIEGEDKVQSVKLKNVKTEQQEEFPCEGVFIFIGMVPNTGFLKDSVELTEKGFIKCDCAYLRTSMQGVFVAGDCRVGAAMQLATAVGDGVNCAMMLKNYFRDPDWWNTQISDMLQPAGW